MTKELSYEAREIKKIRKEAKLTQAEMAARIGVTVRTFARWELGETSLPDNALGRVEAAVNKKATIERSQLANVLSIDLALEVTERLRQVDRLEEANRELRDQLAAYRSKYGSL